VIVATRVLLDDPDVRSLSVRHRVGVAEVGDSLGWTGLLGGDATEQDKAREYDGEYLDSVGALDRSPDVLGANLAPINAPMV
jgi:hypothetical protein